MGLFNIGNFHIFFLEILRNWTYQELI